MSHVLQRVSLRSYYISRPVRPFFRVCLLSLAAGDLISIIFQSTSYVAQLTSIYPPIWVCDLVHHTHKKSHILTQTRATRPMQTLGAFMCSAVPFMTTWAVLVNSFVLVAIALDRYVAVGKVWKMPKGWEPTLLVCIGVAAVAWTLGAAIAVPMLTGYETVDVFVIATDPANRTIQVDVWPAQVCVGGKVGDICVGNIFVISSICRIHSYRSGGEFHLLRIGIQCHVLADGFGVPLAERCDCQ